MLKFICMQLIVFSIISPLFSCCGCRKSIKGSGKVISEKRIISEFYNIELNASANIYLSQGNTQSVEVNTDDNLMTLLHTDVKDGILRIYFDKSVENISKLNIYVTVEKLKGVNILGSGNIIGENKFKISDLQLKCNGSGSIILNLEGKKITTEILGSANIDLSGNVKEHGISIKGSGNVNSLDLSAGKSKIDISGSGKCKVMVSEELNINISGSGTVLYKGQPNIKRNILGSGKCIKYEK